eukprot:387006_1
MAMNAMESGGTLGAKKQVARRTVDVGTTMVHYLNTRIYSGGLPRWCVSTTLQPHSSYIRRMPPSFSILECPASCICTCWVKTSVNKQRSAVNVLSWSPEGTTRCITGNSSGEFTLWKDGAFNFERIMQAHDTPIRAMAWSHSGSYMITSDQGGVIKYWEPSMTNVQAFTAHGGQPIRGLSFGPRDTKFVSCSDDSTLRVWDWDLYKEERVLQGHGWDVKSCDWHPYKSLIASCSKDNLTKLWDPRVGTALSTLYGHKNTVMDVKWNKCNGNWLLSCSRDQLIKLYDIRTMQEMATFKGHGKEVIRLAWHPFQESLFLSSSFDGSLIYWTVGSEDAQAVIPYAHDDSAIWDIAWHPLGHCVATGSNDCTVKLWSRSKPGDPLGILPEVDEGGNPVPGTGGNMFDTGHQRRGEVIAEGGRVIGGGMGAGKSAMVGNASFVRPGGRTPPDGYVCNKCHVPGHYIQQCPQASIPPPHYVCHNCGQRGHYRSDCPQKLDRGVMTGMKRRVDAI